MAITFTITASGTNIVSQSNLSASLSKQLQIATISDTENGAAVISEYTFDWYFIDKPTNTTASIDVSLTASNNIVKLDAIDTWGTYRIFVVATRVSDSSKSEGNPLKAIEEHFVNITVKSTNNELEKPANFQRNWQSQYNKLVDIVDDSTKRISNIKVSSATTLSLPSNDGTSGQVLKTDGTGNLSFASIDLASLESNITLNSLSDVTAATPTDGQVLAWDNALSTWKSLTISSSNASDKIEEGNSSVEVIDSNSNGSIVFNTEGSNRWKINETGHFLPEAEGTYDLGKYVSFGSADNRQIKDIYAEKIYLNNNSLTLTGMSSSDFDITIEQSTLNTFKMPFYLNTASPQASKSGHILIKDFDDGSSNWSPWGANLPSTSSGSEGDILVLNSAGDELSWQSKTSCWTSSYDNEWTTTTVHSSSYNEGTGKSIFIFAFKNITGKTITIKKISLSCLEMYSDTISWSANGSTDAEFKSNQASSILASQTITKSNEDIGNSSGIGESSVTLSESFADNTWLTIMINAMSSSSSNNKRFIVEANYEVV